MKDKAISRRSFLQVSLVTAGAAMLGACAPSVPTGSGAPEVAATQAVPEPTTQMPMDELIELTVALREHPAQPILQGAPAHLAVTEHTGITLKFMPVPQADYSSKQELWLASDQVPDLMYSNVSTYSSYAMQGVILSQSGLIDAHAPNLKKYVDAYGGDMKRFAIDGQLYSVPGQAYNAKVMASMPMIRSDILDELQLDEPTNFDELYEVLKEFKRAYPDSACWTNREGSEQLLEINAYPMGSGFPVYWDKDVEGGKWLFGPIHPEFREVLAYFASAFADGILDADFAVTSGDQWHEKNSSGSGLYCWENMTFGVRWNLAIRDTAPTATWKPLRTLNGPKGPRQINYEEYYRGWVFGSGNKYPERTMQLLDWMVTPVGLDTTNWGLEGVHYQLNKPRPTGIDDYSLAGISQALGPQSKSLLSEVFDSYAAKSDPFRSYQSETGTGLLDFQVLVDNAVTHLWDPPGETDAWYQMTAADPGLHRPWLSPSFTEAETERLRQVRTDVDAILMPGYDGVIIGRMTLDQYDQLVQQAIRAGAEEIEAIYNEAEARL